MSVKLGNRISQKGKLLEGWNLTACESEIIVRFKYQKNFETVKHTVSLNIVGVVNFFRNL